MANSYKDIIITPNRGNTADPKIEFRGGNSSVNTAITLQTYPISNGTLSFEGAAGQLFSITNDLTGSIFSVNDVSGIPSIEVFANGQINLAEFGGVIVTGNTSPITFGANATIRGANPALLFSSTVSGRTATFGMVDAYNMQLTAPSGGLLNIGPTTFIGNVTFGSANHLILSSTSGVSANGTFGTAGHTLHSNGTSVYWAADDQGVTSVATANGLSGGTITSTGTLGVTTGSTLTVNTTGIHVNSALSITSLALAGAASGITTLAAGNTTITGFANVTTTLQVGGAATFNANVTLGAADHLILNSTSGISANGTFGSNTQVLTSNGTTAYWANVSGGASAGGVIWENSANISTTYTLSTGKNGMSVGPINIQAGSSVTVPTDSRWVIL